MPGPDTSEEAEVAEGKRKYIEDAARVIDGRVAELKDELVRVSDKQPEFSNAADMAAILEAEHCARLIRALGLRPYRGDPYNVAREAWWRGEAN